MAAAAANRGQIATRERRSRMSLFCVMPYCDATGVESPCLLVSTTDTLPMAENEPVEPKSRERWNVPPLVLPSVLANQAGAAAAGVRSTVKTVLEVPFT